MSERSPATSPPSLITCTISPLITNTLPHSPTLDHSQQHSPNSKTPSLSPSRPHPIIPHHTSFTVDLSPSKCLIPLPNNRLANFNFHLTSFHSTSQSPHLHFTITASNHMHIYFRSNAPHHRHSTTNQPIHTTPITTPTPPTTSFPHPTQKTYSPFKQIMKR